MVFAHAAYDCQQVLGLTATAVVNPIAPARPAEIEADRLYAQAAKGTGQGEGEFIVVISHEQGMGMAEDGPGARVGCLRRRPYGLEHARRTPKFRWAIVCLEAGCVDDEAVSVLHRFCVTAATEERA